MAGVFEGEINRAVTQRKPISQGYDDTTVQNEEKCRTLPHFDVSTLHLQCEI